MATPTGQQQIPAGVAGVIYAAQPLWSAAFGYLVLGESLGPRALAGAACVLAATLVAAVESGASESPIITSRPSFRKAPKIAI